MLKKHYLVGISKSGKNIVTSSQPNGHIVITGKSGSGKSCLINNFTLQALTDTSCIIIDVGNSFSDLSEIYEDLNIPKNKIITINAEKDKIPINPFAYAGILEYTDSSAMNTANILKQCLCMGEQQKNEIYAVISSIFKNCSENVRNIKLKDIYNILIKNKNRDAQSAAKRLVPFTLLNFDEKIADSWGNILYGNPKVYIFQLSSLSDEMRKQTADFILAHLLSYAERFRNTEKGFVIILDELQKLNSLKDYPVAKIMTEGRKYGINCICATQFDDFSKNKNMLNYIEQAATRIYLKPGNVSVNRISKLLGNNADWKNIIRSMPCGEDKNGMPCRYGIVHKSDDSKPEDMMVKIFSNQYIAQKFFDK